MSNLSKVLLFLKIRERRLVTMDYDELPFYQRRFNKYNPLTYVWFVIIFSFVFIKHKVKPNWHIIKSGYYFKWR